MKGVKVKMVKNENVKGTTELQQKFVTADERVDIMLAKLNKLVEEREKQINQRIEEGIEKEIAKEIEEGRKEGRKIGLEEGREEGRKIGREEGLKKSKEDVAKNMLKENISIDFIMKITDLSYEEIKQLSKNLKN